MTGLLLRPAPAAAGRVPERPTGPLPVFRALSDPLRWELLGHLCRRGETRRSELERVLGVSKTMLTYHVRALVQAGLIEASGSARRLTYAVREDAIAQLRGWLGDPRSAGQEE
ncbi:ArsR/SmtB family transcription factor [Trujillonella endophytica]|uniref:Helix-turn-helix domain-containing protein n=1 Tax=Trujillonella endophytica TaxID=673521 RepID=A0A1H8QKK5_9ACTN|nr:helix-turn-helix domain-containing protein [Trujillella endophytica]SEO54750.1 Helix-turn-helix domain-containing protein [Trujillella endophytica]